MKRGQVGCCKVRVVRNDDGQPGLRPDCELPATRRVTDTTDDWLRQYFCDVHCAEYLALNDTCVSEALRA